MDAGLNISPEEHQTINHALEALGNERGWGVGEVNFLLWNWYRLVEQVEEEYGLTASEYENDVDSRQILEVLKSRLPQHLCDELNRVLQTWDTRFTRATLEVRENMCTPTLEPPGFWCYRAPSKLTKDWGSIKLWLGRFRQR